MLPSDFRQDKLTFNVKFRYSDERDYRLHACGIITVQELQDIVSSLAGLCGVEDIRIGYDQCFTEFKIYSV